jgi:uncharacterized protein YbjT (DUF2867 family)
MPRVLVTAATGKTGLEVTKLLAARPDATVRAASRDPATLGSNGSEPVRFDWQAPETWEAALDGVDAIYLVRPEIEDAPERVGEFLRAADGVERVVLLSDLGVDAAPPSSWERRVEHAVTGQAIAWTVLRPTSFAQTLIAPEYFLVPIRDYGVVALASGGASTSLVDTRDIAAVAVEGLLGRDHAGRTYALTGPEAMTLAELVAKLSDATGRPISYLDQPIDENLALLFGTETQTFMAGLMRRFMEHLSAGAYDRLTDDVKQVTGREPRSIDAFVEEHVAFWKP